MGPKRTIAQEFRFAADEVEARLAGMEIPAGAALSEAAPVRLEIDHPGHVGEVLLDPDGGSWMRGWVTKVSRRRGAMASPASGRRAAIGSLVESA